MYCIYDDKYAQFRRSSTRIFYVVFIVLITVIIVLYSVKLFHSFLNRLLPFPVNKDLHKNALAGTTFADIARLQIHLDLFVARSRRIEVFVWNADPTRLTS